MLRKNGENLDMHWKLNRKSLWLQVGLIGKLRVSGFEMEMVFDYDLTKGLGRSGRTPQVLGFEQSN